MIFNQAHPVRSWVKCFVFLGTGTALIATSPAPVPGIHYSKSVAAFTSTLNNEQPKARISLLVTAQPATPEQPPVREADLMVSLSAQHETSTPPLDPPWLRIRLVEDAAPTALPTAGAPGAGGTAEQELGAFLTGTTYSHRLVLDETGHAEVTFELTRALVADVFDTHVTWTPTLQAFVKSKKDETRDLPWDVEVISEVAP